MSASQVLSAILDLCVAAILGTNSTTKHLRLSQRRRLKSVPAHVASTLSADSTVFWLQLKLFKTGRHAASRRASRLGAAEDVGVRNIADAADRLQKSRVD